MFSQDGSHFGEAEHNERGNHQQQPRVREQVAYQAQGRQQPNGPDEEPEAPGATAQDFLDMLRSDLEGTLRTAMPLLFQYANTPVATVFSQPGFAEEVEVGVRHLQGASLLLQQLLHPQPRRLQAKVLTGGQSIGRRPLLPPTPASTPSLPSTASSNALGVSHSSSRASSALSASDSSSVGLAGSEESTSRLAKPPPGYTPATQISNARYSFNVYRDSDSPIDDREIDSTNAAEGSGTGHNGGDQVRGTKRAHAETTLNDDHEGEDDFVVTSEKHYPPPGYTTADEILVVHAPPAPARPTRVIRSYERRFDVPAGQHKKSTPATHRTPALPGAQILNGHRVHTDRDCVIRRGFGKREPSECMPEKLAFVEAHGAFAQDMDEPTRNRDELVGYAVDQERVKYPLFAEGEYDEQIVKARNLYLNRRDQAIKHFFKHTAVDPSKLDPIARVRFEAAKKVFRTHTYEVKNKDNDGTKGEPMKWKPVQKLRSLVSEEKRAERDAAFNAALTIANSAREDDRTVQHARFPQLMVPAPLEEGPAQASDQLTERSSTGADGVCRNEEADDDLSEFYRPPEDGHVAEQRSIPDADDGQQQLQDSSIPPDVRGASNNASEVGHVVSKEAANRPHWHLPTAALADAARSASMPRFSRNDPSARTDVYDRSSLRAHHWPVEHGGYPENDDSVRTAGTAKRPGDDTGFFPQDGGVVDPPWLGDFGRFLQTQNF